MQPLLLFDMQVPELSNQVLLSDLLLDDNSIMSLSSIQNAWLPSVVNLSVAHNRYTCRHAVLFDAEVIG